MTPSRPPSLTSGAVMAVLGVVVLGLVVLGVVVLRAADVGMAPSTGAERSSARSHVDAGAGDRGPGGTLPTSPDPSRPPPATAAELAAPARFITSGRDAPDPFMLVTGGRYHLFTSQGSLAGNNVPVVTGTSVGHWGPVEDAMPTLPSWVVPGFTWAPDVHRFGDRYVLYFTAATDRTTPPDECIGAATGSSPTGPFVAGSQPFICQTTQRGSIDPRTFTDPDGTTYMLWKSDDNADVNGTEMTNIYAQPLSADGLHLLGTPTRIFGPDEPWQGRIVEAPDMVLVDGTYWLFYSGGWFNQPGYAIGVATCDGPLGPCADASPSPWLASNAQGPGPGEESLFQDGTGIWMLYTPWMSGLPGPTIPRPVAMVRLGFGALGPYVAATGTAAG